MKSKFLLYSIEVIGLHVIQDAIDENMEHGQPLENGNQLGEAILSDNHFPFNSFSLSFVWLISGSPEQLYNHWLRLELLSSVTVGNQEVPCPHVWLPEQQLDRTCMCAACIDDIGDL